MRRANWLRLYFLVSVGLVLFAYGVAVGLYKIFPYRILETVAATAVDWVQYPGHNARLVPEKFLFPARHAGNGVVEYVRDKAYPGETFITGFFEDRPGMKLIDMDGRTLHQWRVSFQDVWPEAPHLRKPLHDWDTQIHGAVLYPNGDVVFNFQYGGLVRIDKCSRVRWKVSHRTHHSVFRDTKGNLWVPARRLHEEPVEKFRNVPAPFEEDYLLKVSPSGRVLQEISVLDAVFRSTYEGVLFASGAHDSYFAMPLDRDFTHLNDVEVLAPQMAPAFPMFEAGDLLISLRNLNALLVLNPGSGKIKWSMTGPYLRQHDPDFLPNGRISVFDNRRDGSEGRIFGGSRILLLDPASGRVVSVYGERDEERFYTEIMGDHQWLPNGNLLITDTLRGHAFEVTADGNRVWSFINRWDEDSVAWIERATRYPARFTAPMEQEKCS